jgi:ornithine cyclodeaminase
LLFEPTTGVVTWIVEGALISAVRTAAVSAVCVESLAPRPVSVVALLGTGALGRAHAALLGAVPGLRELRIHDVDPVAAQRLAADCATDATDREVTVVVCPDAREAVHDADVVVPATTVRAGYLPLSWLRAGSLLVNVSLDDPLPEVFERCDRLLVDDFQLVVEDPHRVLGRLVREGRIAPPEGCGGSATAPGARRIDAELGDYLARMPWKPGPDERVVVNPFGLAVEDLALVAEVCRVAGDAGLGLELPR